MTPAQATRYGIDGGGTTEHHTRIGACFGFNGFSRYRLQQSPAMGSGSAEMRGHDAYASLIHSNPLAFDPTAP